MDDPDSAYKSKTRVSDRMFTESAKMHVNGVSHNIRYFDPYPFVVRSSAASHMTDVDGNKYTDYWMGHWSLILGHAPAPVTQALHRQVDSGWMYGTVNEQTLDLSKMISGTVPAAEKIRYTASGTEAVMYAVRLARSYTKKQTVAKIDGGWHGYASDMLKSVNWPFESPESAGLVGDDKIVSIPYNDLDASINILQECKDDLACVVIEPVLGGAGGIPASRDYLAGMKEYAHRNGALFILDEIVTGFRFRYGCMHDSDVLKPDMVTLGKIIGGGLAIGAVCGADEIMKIAGAPRGSRSYIGGGTFSANPTSMTAGGATLRHLKENPSIYDFINSTGSRARAGLEEVLEKKGAVITGNGSIFMAHFAPEGSEISAEISANDNKITNARQASLCDLDKLRRYQFKMIAQDGIFMLPGKLGAISAAHTHKDIEHLVAASDDFK